VGEVHGRQSRTIRKQLKELKIQDIPENQTVYGNAYKNGGEQAVRDLYTQKLKSDPQQVQFHEERWDDAHPPRLSCLWGLLSC
jgi:hypothetical protein